MTDWTDERTEALKKLWEDGLTASQIAKQLGGVSRSAVISKAHRLNCSARKVGARPKPVPSPLVRRLPERPSRPVARAQHSHPLPRVAAVPAPWEIPGSATSQTLGAHMCKWPIGDPSGDHFTFCGSRQERGPYCGEHARIAYGPPAAKASANRWAVSRLGYADVFAAS